MLYVVRGIAASIVLAPVALAAGAIAGLTLLGVFVSVPDPIGRTPLDLLADPSGRATYRQYAQFMVSVVVAAIAVGGIGAAWLHRPR